jgi:murein DD-endopeptidase MepM/ murein hydrolase activator NlpD
LTNPSPKRLQFNGKFPVLPKLDLGRFWDKGGAKTTLVVVSALVISLLVLAGWMMFFSANAVQVLVDGQEIGLIKDREAAEEALAMLLAEVNQTAASPLEFRETITYQPVRAKANQLLSPQRLKAAFAERLTFLTGAVAIEINGEPQLIVQDDKTARYVLQRIKETYTPKADGVSDLQVAFVERVLLVPQEVEPEQVTDAKEAIRRMLEGTKKIQQHTVKPGESLWTIARANGLTVEELREANPQLKSDRLRIGQEINLLKADPLVNVSVSYERTVRKSIPAPVRVQSDTNLWRGQERVLERGRAGEKEVVYKVLEQNGILQQREVLSEKVITEPTTRVISRGTRQMLASREGMGSGRLGWPIRGRITSPFGPRWGGFHVGLDIAGDRGDPVFASESGRVIFSGWQGNYGKRVVIDHGGGKLTSYSHLSRYKVEEGAQVEKGALVGLIGSTGRSTGPHLHFEVITNGNFRNPINFLSR